MMHSRTALGAACIQDQLFAVGGQVHFRPAPSPEYPHACHLQACLPAVAATCRQARLCTLAGRCWTRATEAASYSWGAT